MSNGPSEFFIGRPPGVKVAGVEGAYMHLGSSVHDTVVFLGFADTTSPGGIRCAGTGFLLLYENEGYLITARHVAEILTRVPFVIRMNKREGNASLLTIDDTIWHYHEDDTVDLAALIFRVPSEAGFDVQYIKQETILTPNLIEKLNLDIGDECYTVGLFRYIYGDQRNFPLAHTGHIALMPPPGERIPVWNSSKKGSDMVEGYLIEGRAIDGASGAPVFARASFAIDSPKFEDPDLGRRIPMLFDQKVQLLGVFQGAWRLPPDEALERDLTTGPRGVVPVGIGVVVPSAKIVELMESGKMKQLRKKSQPVTPVAHEFSVSQPKQEPSTKEDNPSHKEDFSRLLDAAARTPKSAD